MNKYELEFNASCPNGELEDVYKIEIESSRIIECEKIIETLESIPSKIYQESLATYLRNKLGCRVRIIGWHHGIKITSTRK